MHYKLTKLLPLLSFLFLSNTILAQYSINDSALVRTTYLRDFDKDIIYNYLSSKDSSKINAALLSIAQSADTTFVDSITKIDLYKHGDFIAFTLGELGRSKKSEDFILHVLSIRNNPYKSQFFDAIGKVGDSLTFNMLLDSVAHDSFKSVGFPLAIYNFFSRGIKNEKSLNYLSNNFQKFDSNDVIFPYNNKHSLNSTEDYCDTTIYINEAFNKKVYNNFYALSRMGSSKEAVPELIKFAKNDLHAQTKLFVLSNLKKLKYFPEDKGLLTKLINSESWQIRTETANAACYYPFQSFSEIQLYLTLLDDENPNVSRSAASSLKNIWKKDVFKDSLKFYLEKKLKQDKLTKNTKGELFISYCSLYPEDIEDKIDTYEDYIERKFIYRVLITNHSDTEFNYDYLTDNISESNEIEMLDLLPALLSLQTRFLNEDEYAAIILKVLSGNQASSISIVADGFRLPYIHNYQDMLQEIIIDQVFKYRDNPQFVEALFSLEKLASKINPNFHITVLSMLNQSKLYSVKKFAASQLGEKLPTKNDTLRFNECWQNAFKYKTAKIKTEKGTITISFKPEYAPITVGNFVTLAENNFYNRVKFHRVVPDFVIQAGDTTGTGWGGPGYEIVSEFSPRPFVKGAVGMASAGKDTEGSQWFIMHSDFPHLNGRYTNWAEVINGMDAVDIIDEGDKIISIKLLK